MGLSNFEAALYLGGFALATGVGAGWNAAWNHKSIETEAYRHESRPRGIFGHVEFTQVADGSNQVKVYHGFGHRMFASELYIDSDGDLEIDLIRRNGPEWKANSFGDLYVRATDYAEHRDLFEEADATLGDLLERFPARDDERF